MPAVSTLASFSISQHHASRQVSSIIPARSLPQETTIEPTLSFPYVSRKRNLAILHKIAQNPSLFICVHLLPISLTQKTTTEPTLPFLYASQAPHPSASISVHLRPPCTNLHNWVRFAARPQEARPQ
jgi:hypothetical protein